MTGECGESDSSGQRLCYQGRSFHAVNEGETLVGGDLAGDGQGAAESIFGGAFDAQQELGVCKHDRAGVLSMQPQPASIMVSRVFRVRAMRHSLLGTPGKPCRPVVCSSGVLCGKCMKGTRRSRRRRVGYLTAQPPRAQSSMQ